jgi:hypothetical protein
MWHPMHFRSRVADRNQLSVRIKVKAEAEDRLPFLNSHDMESSTGARYQK